MHVQSWAESPSTTEPLICGSENWGPGRNSVHVQSWAESPSTTQPLICGSENWGPGRTTIILCNIANSSSDKEYSRKSAIGKFKSLKHQVVYHPIKKHYSGTSL